METTTDNRERAIFQMLCAIAFLAITMPLGLIFALHRASNAQSGDYAEFRFAWPIYTCAAIGAVVALNAFGAWIGIFVDKHREPDSTQK